jgi:predicted Zn-dependent peptidase
MRRPSPRVAAAAAALALLAACGGARPTPEAPVVPPGDRSRIPQPGKAPALKLPPQRHFQLASGLKVRLVEHHKLPVVALHLVVDGGAVHDPAELPGLASFTAAMLTEGTKTRTATQISDDLGFIGASLGAGAGFDSASLSGSVLSAHLDELLRIFADVLQNPTFPAGDFARVQDQRFVALVQQRDQPGVVAAKTFKQLYWGDHPYGHWPQGTEASVRATRREDLVRYHAERWTPAGSELVVVGDVTEKELAAKLEKALAGWKGSAAPVAAAAVAKPPRLQTVLVEKRGAAPQAYLLMGMPGLQRSSPDFVAAEVAAEVLGGGSFSRLFRHLREEEGYTYGMYAQSDARKLGGTNLIVGSVKSESTGAATKALLAEIGAMRTKPVPADELAVARNSLLLSLPAQFETTAGIASKLAEEVIYALPDNYWDQYAAQVARVSADDVRRVSQKYLDPERLTTVMVCDPGAVKPQLAGLPLGKVSVRAGPVPATPDAKAKPKAKSRAQPKAPPTAGR